MKSSRIKLFLSGVLLSALLCVAGCANPFASEKTEPFARLDSREAILDALQNTMNNNEGKCTFLVASEELIDANAWLAAYPGIKHINCEYKQIQSGYNVTVTLSYWDNYPIMHAYRTGDSSKLAARQQELLGKYEEVLAITHETASSTADWILNVHDYLVANISYDASQDNIFNAYDAMINGKAICSGYAESFKTLVEMIGVPCITISGTAGGEKHMWNMVCLDEQWYHVDVTWDDPINNEEDLIEHAYFNITDSAMAVDHTWEASLYPAAVSTDYSYYNLEGITLLYTQAELDDYIARKVYGGYHYVEILVYGSHDLKTSFNKLDGSIFSYSFSSKQRDNYTIYSISIKY